MELWRGEYSGRLPRINAKYGARCIGGKGRAYVTAEYRQGVEAMAWAFAGREAPIEDAVNVYVEVSMWSRIDSDAPIKAIFDALEKAGVVKEDNQIRDFVVLRRFHKRDDIDHVTVVIVEEAEPVAEFPE